MGKVYIFEISAKGWWKTDEDGLSVSNPLPKPSDFFVGSPGRSIEGDVYYNGGDWSGVLEYEVWKQTEIDPNTDMPIFGFYKAVVKESVQKPEDLNEDKTSYKRYTAMKIVYPQPDEQWQITTHKLSVAIHGLTQNTRDMTLGYFSGYDPKRGYYYYYDTVWKKKIFNFFRSEIYYRCVLELGGVFAKKRYDYFEAKLRPFEYIPFEPDVLWIHWKLERWLKGDEVSNYYIINNHSARYYPKKPVNPNTDYYLRINPVNVQLCDGITFEFGNYNVFYPDKLTLKTNYSDFYPRLRFGSNFQSNGVICDYYREGDYYVFSAEVVDRYFRLIWEGYQYGEYPPRTYIYRFDDDNGSRRRMFVRYKQPFLAFYKETPVQPFYTTQGELLGGLGRVNDLGAYDKVCLRFPEIHEIQPDPNTPIMKDRINVRVKWQRRIIDIGTTNKHTGDFEVGGKIVRWLYRYDEPAEPYPNVYPTKRPYDEDDFDEGLIFKDRLKTSLGYEFDVYATWHCNGTLVVVGFCDVVVGYEWSFGENGWSVNPKTKRVQAFGFEALGLDPHRYFVSIFRSPSGKKIHFLAYDRESGTLYEVLTVIGGDLE